MGKRPSSTLCSLRKFSKYKRTHAKAKKGSEPILFGTILAVSITYPKSGIARSARARIIGGIAGKKRKKVRDEDVTGLKYFDKLAEKGVRPKKGSELFFG